MADQSKFNRNLTIAVGGLVVVQLLIAGVVGLKPPTIEAGYYQVPTNNLSATPRAVLSEARQQELEALLSPPPILSWSDVAKGEELPEDLTNKSLLFSFVDPPSAKLDAPEAPNVPDVPDASPSNQLPEPNAATPRLLVPSLDGDGLLIKPVYLAKLPDLKPLSVDQRKAQFVAVVLPLVLRANLELAERRQLVMDAAAANDGSKLMQWAELYRLKTDNKDMDEISAMLLKRIDLVPVSIALAQAAIESGWGTSRFAVQGNALYGQWAWSKDAGITPAKASREDAVVRSFTNLFDSVRAYMHNLNTHPVYEDFRAARANKQTPSIALVKELINYSEEREVYITKLYALINRNNFQAYENAQLSSQ